MVNIDLIYVEGCSSTPETLNLINEVVNDLGIEAKINTILVENSEQAKQWKFFGSPTVQINGVDIDPEMRNKEWFGIT